MKWEALQEVLRPAVTYEGGSEKKTGGQAGNVKISLGVT